MNTIVLGTNHNNTLGLLWSLGAAGHTITLLLYNGECNYVKASKYVSSTYLINKGDDVIALLKDVALNMDSRPVVFVSNDKDATLLNEHAEELSEFCFFEGGRSDGSINLYRDKDEGEKMAQKSGFTIPKTVVISRPEDISKVELPYPLFVKGNNSVHGGKAAMKKCDNHAEAEVFVNGLPQDFFPLQIQEFVEKDYEIMLLGCSLNYGSDIVCPIANKKIRQYPKHVGLGAFSESIYVQTDEDLRSLSANVARYMHAIGYTGLFSAEFLYSNGTYFFLEVNLRNDGTSWLSTCSGFNLPDILCRSLNGEIVTVDERNFKKMYYMNIMADIKCVRSKEISLLEWLKQLNNRTCYSLYNRRDRKPFLLFMSNLIKSHLK